MTTEDHEMESGSSMGNDDDPNFVPKFISKKSRTESVLQTVMSVVTSKVASPPEDPRIGRDTSLLRQTQEQLLQRITGACNVSGVQKICQDWYLTYLDARVQKSLPIAAKVLRETGTNTASFEIRSNIDMYRVLILVAQSLEESSESTLRSTVTSLKDNNLLRDGVDELANQLVFQCLGWLTALFDPCPEPSTTHLSLRNKDYSSHRRSLVRKTVIRHSCVAIADAQLPIQRFLRRFGSLLPEPECVRRSDEAGGLEAGTQDIIATYVYFHNLKLLNVKIKWVNVLNQHLEFDRRNRILRVFRLPSICRLMLREKGTLLDGLCQEDEDESDERSRCPHFPVAEIEGFLSEVILSFRLIFGCHRRSRALLNRILMGKKNKWQRDGCYDPLLEILCTQTENSSEVQELYSDLDAKVFQDYVMVDEFPFLARRLFDLQQFSIAKSPHSWKRLWNDQRNITLWFTTWAVVILGGGTLFIQMAQLVFQIYQPFNNSGS